ncbi:MAG: hypothetical protein ACXWLL_11875, partial [Myxococcaceae bacterium]
MGFIRGEMRSYLALITHSDDYTLMAPFGGPPRRGFDRSPARLAELSRTRSFMASAWSRRRRWPGNEPPGAAPSRNAM